MRAETSQILTQAHTGSRGLVGLTAEQPGGRHWVIWVLLGHGHQYWELQWLVQALKVRGEGEGDFHGG